MKDFDLDAIVQETFDLSLDVIAEEKEKASLFNFSSGGIFVTPEEECGLFYTVDKRSSIYIIRSFVSSNLKQDYERILAKGEDFPSLKLDLDTSIEEQLRYFECPSLECATVLQDTFCNRRFPLREESLFNVSDHSDHWWIYTEDKEIKISFKLRSGQDEWQKLIALGGPSEFSSALQVAHSFLSSSLCTKEFAATDSLFTFSVQDKSSLFLNLKAIFTGEAVCESFWGYLEDLKERPENQNRLESLTEVIRYLRELSLKRKFYSRIEATLLD